MAPSVRRTVKGLHKIGPVTGVFAEPVSGGRRFYDGSPGRRLVKCPDCGHDADELFGDHGGQCIDTVNTPTPMSALGIIRAAALKLRRFSMNDVRAEFDRHDVKKTSRGPAFAAAVRREWLEEDGTVPSLDGRTKRHRIQVYK